MDQVIHSSIPRENFIIHDETSGETLFSYITFPEETFLSTHPTSDTNNSHNYGWFLLYTPSTGEVYLYNKYYVYDYSISNQAIERELETIDIQKIINYAFSKYFSFGLKDSLDNSKTILISFDKPSHNKNADTTGYVSFHQDGHYGYIGTYFWNNTQNRQKIIPDKSHFTCIQYFPKDICVSTTINLNTTKSVDPTNEEIVRYIACKGTMLCINNHRFKHATPYHTRNTRPIGDFILAQNVLNEDINRSLCRLQFTALDTPLILYYPKDFYKINVHEYRNLPTIIPKTITYLPFTEYLSPHSTHITHRGIEVGGRKTTDKTHIIYNNKQYKIYYEKHDKTQKYISSKATGKVLLSSIRGKYRYSLSE